MRIKIFLQFEIQTFMETERNVFTCIVNYFLFASLKNILVLTFHGKQTIKN